jgi:Flp pilus assembly protein TadG
MTQAEQTSLRRAIRSARTAVGTGAHFLRDRRGVAALEFALVASGFLMLLLGSIEIGLLWWTENGLQATAALTARCAALGSCADPKAFAVSTASGWTLPNAITNADVIVTAASTCHGSSGGYSQFTLVTITSTVWSGILIAPLSGASLKATACYPRSN